MEAVASLKERLPQITSPVLLFSSRVDHVVPPSTGDFLQATLTSPLEQVVLERSHHVATLDYDADEIARKTIDFMAKVVVHI